MKTSIAELQILTEREKKFRIYERQWEAHSTGRDLGHGIVADQDFAQALMDKWGMLVYADANTFLGGY